MSVEELRQRHPRPTLVREAYWALEPSVPFRWDHSVDEIGVPRAESELDQRILLPFAPETAASGIGAGESCGTLWYALTIPSEAVRDAREGGGALLLHLEAVFGDVRVWVRGDYVGGGSRGYSRQSFDLTRFLPAPGESLVAMVEVTVDHQDHSRPRGKQDWLDAPHGIWYGRTSGMWREPWVEVVAKNHIIDVMTTTRLESNSVSIEVEFNQSVPRGSRVSVELSKAAARLGRALTDVQGRRAVVRIDLPELDNEHERGSILWSPEHPHLVDLEVVLTVGDKQDRVHSYAGLRAVSARGESFLLNERPYAFRAVLEQYYWPSSHFTAPSDGAREDEAGLIKELGLNGVRIHQTSPDPRFLYWCDRVGLLVWAEMPSAYRFDPDAIRLSVDEWLAIVRQTRSHPSVVTWVPFNESWGVPALEQVPAQRAFVQGVTQLTRSLDPTRPVISNDGWEHVDSDILTFHEYAQEGGRLARRFADDAWLDPASGQHPFAGRRAVVSEAQRADVPVMLTEFGGIAYRTSGTTDVWGYGVVDAPEAFEAGLRDLVATAQALPGLAGWCYTQLTDTLQEANGLLDENRRPKIPMEVMRTIFTPRTGF